MTAPNTMCNPPNPAPSSQLPQAGGPNSAAAPASMKHSPITGTMRTENAPPVTKPGPYRSSHTPGSASHSTPRHNANASTPPTAMGGVNPTQDPPPGQDR